MTDDIILATAHLAGTTLWTGMTPWTQEADLEGFDSVRCCAGTQS